ncbi:hypothetical protein MRX96_033905 [Rhipicephalus microplus]|uniref:Uncharacterized protein n=1 Tax=Rhipicephalus microplus TaxID=6941 RepID=A0A9J6DC63_RHIMP|nr:hypothetical protein HPB51_020467 [Rhipicephalus microplus]KAH8019658.1 hypothetical protein HPB51_020469 [Rhipicephalus microplus]KAH8032972.1 hypothetical protein HPB51_004653 [Rhipicephalus microplus]KAH8035316.1 hypothetical protein HPB51_004557 [Rhipicephalus microplus]
MDMDDAEEAGVEPTVLEEPPVRATTSCAAHDTVGDHSEMFSSGCSSNMINTECDAVSVPTARVTTINDFVLKIKKQLCLLFFRVAEVHKLPHSTAESVFNDFKITFLDIIRTFASVIENNIAMESAGIELRKLLAGEFLEDIFQAASSKYKREQFAKRHLPYVKPEVRDLGADIVPKQNEHWEVYLLLRSIADITFADKIPHDHLAYLQDEIRFFLSSFAALYPGAIIPKLHFLIHYPRLISELGPLKQYWCMRYEAKHQYMKTIAQRNQNFRNICKSIAERHQLLQSFEFSNLEVDRGIQTKRSRQLKLEDLCSYMRKVVSPGIPVWEVGSAEVENLVFKKFDVVILEKQQLPLFGQIRRLYIYCGSLFLLVDVLMTVRFDRHRWSYVVDNTDEQKLVQPFNLPSPQVLDLYFGAELMLRPEIMIVE